MAQYVTYGEGGFDSSKPNNNIIRVDDLEPTPVEILRMMRSSGYSQKSDPLFFKWQRGEATEQEWLEAIQQVKADHPYT